MQISIWLFLSTCFIIFVAGFIYGTFWLSTHVKTYKMWWKR